MSEVGVFGRMGGRVAAFALVTGLLFLTSASMAAFADTPHVRASIDTASCAACHSAHTAYGSVLLRAEETSPAVTATCLICHDGGDNTASNVASGPTDSFALPSGHSLTAESSGTVRVSGCSTCHDIHAASSDSRRIPAKPINGAGVSSTGKQVCLACHDSSADWFGPGYPQTSSPTRDATGYPVAGTWTGSSTYESSSNAHRLIPEATRTVGVSEPIRREQGDCLYCHAAHGGANAYDGLLTTYTVPSQATLASDQADGSYAALCFSCHSGEQPSGFATAPVNIKQFVTAAGGAGGHSIVTSGGTLPVGSPLPCFECHNPHGSSRGNGSLLSDERGASLATTGAADAASVRAFCFTCHTTSGTALGWDSVAETYNAVASTETVVGLARDGAALHLTNTDGHALGDSASCYECHGNSYDTGGNNVHNPGEAPVAPRALALVSWSTTSTVSSAAVDASAAVGSTTTVVATDTTPPVTISDVLTTYTVTATITLSAVDDTGGVGVADTYWTLDGSETATGTIVSTSTIGPHSLTYWSVDYAGNVESATVASFTIDAEQASAFLPVLAARLGQVIADAGG